MSNVETCRNCDGEGVIHTGIDEALTTICPACDGAGDMPVAAAVQGNARAALEALHTHMQNSGHYGRDETVSLFKQVVSALAPVDAAPVDAKAAQQAFEDYFCTTLSCDGVESVELIEACRSAASDAWHEATRRAAAQPSTARGDALSQQAGELLPKDLHELLQRLAAWPDGGGSTIATADAKAILSALAQRAASQRMSADQFEEEYASRSNTTVEELRKRHRVVLCNCDDEQCQGWQMFDFVSAAERAKWEACQPHVERDAARWRYAMNWNTDNFAVCMRDDGAWCPMKTNGPIDVAMAAQQNKKGGA